MTMQDLAHTIWQDWFQIMPEDIAAPRILHQLTTPGQRPYLLEYIREEYAIRRERSNRMAAYLAMSMLDRIRALDSLDSAYYRKIKIIRGRQNED